MAKKSSKTQKPVKSSDAQAKRSIRMLQIFFVVFSIMLILSMVLSLTR